MTHGLEPYLSQVTIDGIPIALKILTAENQQKVLSHYTRADEEYTRAQLELRRREANAFAALCRKLRSQVYFAADVKVFPSSAQSQNPLFHLLDLNQIATLSLMHGSFTLVSGKTTIAHVVKRVVKTGDQFIILPVVNVQIPAATVAANVMIYSECLVEFAGLLNARGRDVVVQARRITMQDDKTYIFANHCIFYASDTCLTNGEIWADQVGLVGGRTLIQKAKIEATSIQFLSLAAEMFGQVYAKKVLASFCLACKEFPGAVMFAGEGMFLRYEDYQQRAVIITPQLELRGDRGVFAGHFIISLKTLIDLGIITVLPGATFLVNGEFAVYDRWSTKFAGYLHYLSTLEIIDNCVRGVPTLDCLPSEIKVHPCTVKRGDEFYVELPQSIAAIVRNAQAARVTSESVSKPSLPTLTTQKPEQRGLIAKLKQFIGWGDGKKNKDEKNELPVDPPPTQTQPKSFVVFQSRLGKVTVSRTMRVHEANVLIQAKQQVSMTSLVWLTSDAFKQAKVFLTKGRNIQLRGTTIAAPKYTLLSEAENTLTVSGQLFASAAVLKAGKQITFAPGSYWHLEKLNVITEGLLQLCSGATVNADTARIVSAIADLGGTLKGKQVQVLAQTLALLRGRIDMTDQMYQSLFVLMSPFAWLSGDRIQVRAVMCLLPGIITAGQVNVIALFNLSLGIYLQNTILAPSPFSIASVTTNLTLSALMLSVPQTTLVIPWVLLTLNIIPRLIALVTTLAQLQKKVSDLSHENADIATTKAEIVIILSSIVTLLTLLGVNSFFTISNHLSMNVDFTAMPNLDWHTLLALSENVMLSCTSIFAGYSVTSLVNISSGIHIALNETTFAALLDLRIDLFRLLGTLTSNSTFSGDFALSEFQGSAMENCLAHIRKNGVECLAEEDIRSFVAILLGSLYPHRSHVNVTAKKVYLDSQTLTQSTIHAQYINVLSGATVMTGGTSLDATHAVNVGKHGKLLGSGIVNGKLNIGEGGEFELGHGVFTGKGIRLGHDATAGFSNCEVENAGKTVMHDGSTLAFRDSTVNDRSGVERVHDVNPMPAAHGRHHHHKAKSDGSEKNEKSNSDSHGATIIISKTNAKIPSIEDCPGDKLVVSKSEVHLKKPFVSDHGIIYLLDGTELFGGIKQLDGATLICVESWFSEKGIDGTIITTILNDAKVQFVLSKGGSFTCSLNGTSQLSFEAVNGMVVIIYDKDPKSAVSVHESDIIFARQYDGCGFNTFSNSKIKFASGFVKRPDGVVIVSQDKEVFTSPSSGDAYDIETNKPVSDAVREKIRLCVEKYSARTIRALPKKLYYYDQNYGFIIVSTSPASLTKKSRYEQTYTYAELRSDKPITTPTFDYSKFELAYHVNGMTGTSVNLGMVPITVYGPDDKPFVYSGHVVYTGPISLKSSESLLMTPGSSIAGLDVFISGKNVTGHGVFITGERDTEITAPGEIDLSGYTQTVVERKHHLFSRSKTERTEHKPTVISGSSIEIRGHKKVKVNGAYLLTYSQKGPITVTSETDVIEANYLPGEINHHAGGFSFDFKLIGIFYNSARIQLAFPTILVGDSTLSAKNIFARGAVFQGKTTFNAKGGEVDLTPPVLAFHRTDISFGFSLELNQKPFAEILQTPSTLLPNLLGVEGLDKSIKGYINSSDQLSKNISAWNSLVYLYFFLQRMRADPLSVGIGGNIGFSANKQEGTYMPPSGVRGPVTVHADTLKLNGASFVAIEDGITIDARKVEMTAPEIHQSASSVSAGVGISCQAPIPGISGIATSPVTVNMKASFSDSNATFCPESGIYAQNGEIHFVRVNSISGNGVINAEKTSGSVEKMDLTTVPDHVNSKGGGFSILAGTNGVLQGLNISYFEEDINTTSHPSGIFVEKNKAHFNEIDSHGASVAPSVLAETKKLEADIVTGSSHKFNISLGVTLKNPAVPEGFSFATGGGGFEHSREVYGVQGTQTENDKGFSMPPVVIPWQSNSKISDTETIPGAMCLAPEGVLDQKRETPVYEINNSEDSVSASTSSSSTTIQKQTRTPTLEEEEEEQTTSTFAVHNIFELFNEISSRYLASPADKAGAAIVTGVEEGVENTGKTVRSVGQLAGDMLIQASPACASYPTAPMCVEAIERMRDRGAGTVEIANAAIGLYQRGEILSTLWEITRRLNEMPWDQQLKLGTTLVTEFGLQQGVIKIVSGLRAWQLGRRVDFSNEIPRSLGAPIEPRQPPPFPGDYHLLPVPETKWVPPTTLSPLPETSANVVVPVNAMVPVETSWSSATSMREILMRTGEMQGYGPQNQFYMQSFAQQVKDIFQLFEMHHARMQSLDFLLRTDNSSFVAMELAGLETLRTTIYEKMDRIAPVLPWLPPEWIGDSGKLSHVLETNMSALQNAERFGNQFPESFSPNYHSIPEDLRGHPNHITFIKSVEGVRQLTKETDLVFVITAEDGLVVAQKAFRSNITLMDDFPCWHAAPLDLVAGRSKVLAAGDAKIRRVRESGREIGEISSIQLSLNGVLLSDAQIHQMKILTCYALHRWGLSEVRFDMIDTPLVASKQPPKTTAVISRGGSVTRPMKVSATKTDVTKPVISNQENPGFFLIRNPETGSLMGIIPPELSGDLDETIEVLEQRALEEVALTRQTKIPTKDLENGKALEKTDPNVSDRDELQKAQVKIPNTESRKVENIRFTMPKLLRGELQLHLLTGEKLAELLSIDIVNKDLRTITDDISELHTVRNLLILEIELAKKEGLLTHDLEEKLAKVANKLEETLAKVANKMESLGMNTGLPASSKTTKVPEKAPDPTKNSSVAEAPASKIKANESADTLALSQYKELEISAPIQDSNPSVNSNKLDSILRLKKSLDKMPDVYAASISSSPAEYTVFDPARSLNHSFIDANTIKNIEGKVEFFFVYANDTLLVVNKKAMVLAEPVYKTARNGELSFWQKSMDANNARLIEYFDLTRSAPVKTAGEGVIESGKIINLKFSKNIYQIRDTNEQRLFTVDLFRAFDFEKVEVELFDARVASDSFKELLQSDDSLIIVDPNPTKNLSVAEAQPSKIKDDEFEKKLILSQYIESYQSLYNDKNACITEILGNLSNQAGRIVVAVINDNEILFTKEIALFFQEFIEIEYEKDRLVGDIYGALLKHDANIFIDSKNQLEILSRKVDGMLARVEKNPALGIHYAPDILLTDLQGMNKEIADFLRQAEVGMGLPIQAESMLEEASSSNLKISDTTTITTVDGVVKNPNEGLFEKAPSSSTKIQSANKEKDLLSEDLDYWQLQFQVFQPRYIELNVHVAEMLEKFSNPDIDFVLSQITKQEIRFSKDMLLFYQQFLEIEHRKLRFFDDILKAIHAHRASTYVDLKYQLKLLSQKVTAMLGQARENPQLSIPEVPEILWISLQSINKDIADFFAKVSPYEKDLPLARVSASGKNAEFTSRTDLEALAAHNLEHFGTEQPAYYPLHRDFSESDYVPIEYIRLVESTAEIRALTEETRFIFLVTPKGLRIAYQSLSSEVKNLLVDFSDHVVTVFDLAASETLLLSGGEFTVKPVAGKGTVMEMFIQVGEQSLSSEKESQQMTSITRFVLEDFGLEEVNAEKIIIVPHSVANPGKTWNYENFSEGSDKGYDINVEDVVLPMKPEAVIELMKENIQYWPNVLRDYMVLRESEARLLSREASVSSAMDAAEIDNLKIDTAETTNALPPPLPPPPPPQRDIAPAADEKFSPSSNKRGRSKWLPFFLPPYSHSPTVDDREEPKEKKAFEPESKRRKLVK